MENQGKHCHNQRKKYLFVLSVYGTVGKEAQVILTTLSQLMAAKIDELILHDKGWIKKA